jgi:hypothetical protein
MWFQDLFNYDFRRTEMCIIPMARRKARSASARTTPAFGWRNIIENMHQNATVAKWYQEHGRHEIFANNHSVKLGDASHRLVVNEVDSGRGREKGVLPQTAKEEQQMMKKLYMQSILKQNTSRHEAGSAEGPRKSEGRGQGCRDSRIVPAVYFH